MSSLSDTIKAYAPDAYFVLDDSGTTFTDSSGNGHNLTANATIVNASSLTVNDARQSSTFDYAGTFFTAGLAYDVSGDPLTVFYIINPASLTAGAAQLYNVVVECATPTTAANGWQCGYKTDGTWVWNGQGTTLCEFTATSPTTIAAVGVTNRVCYVKRTLSSELYVDGVFRQSKVTVGMTGGAGNLRISGYTTFTPAAGYQIKATVAHLAIFKTALTAPQIAAIDTAARGLTAPPANVQQWQHGMGTV